MRYYITLLFIACSFMCNAQQPSYFISSRVLYQSQDTVKVEIVSNLYNTKSCYKVQLKGFSMAINNKSIVLDVYYRLPLFLPANLILDYCKKTDTLCLTGVANDIEKINLSLFTYVERDTNLIDTTNEHSTHITFLPLKLQRVNDVDKSVIIYPNPTHTGFSINAVLHKDIREAKVVIIDGNGKTVYVFSYPVSSGVLNANIKTSNLPSGIYTLRVHTARDVIVKQFTVQ